MATPSLVCYPGAPCSEQRSLGCLWSVGAGSWMKRKLQWYRELGEILSIIFFPASSKLLRHCLSVCLPRWDVFRRWKNVEQREIKCSRLPGESNPECEQCPALQAKLLPSPPASRGCWGFDPWEELWETGTFLSPAFSVGSEQHLDIRTTALSVVALGTLSPHPAAAAEKAG